MEVNQDVDIDSLLLQQFSCIQTQDREVLISELQKVIGDQASAKDCEFFLDMNNWNLQGAVWSYFDLQAEGGGIGVGPPLISLPKMSVVQQEASLGGVHRDTRTALPGQTFMQSWRLMNCGTERWPPGCCLRHFAGPQMAMADRVSVDGIQPGGVVDVQLMMAAPPEPGVYTSQWKMSTLTGTYFGELLCVGVQVLNHSASATDEDVTSRFSSLMAHDDSSLPAPPPSAIGSQSEPLLHIHSLTNTQGMTSNPLPFISPPPTSEITTGAPPPTSGPPEDTMEMS